MFNDTKTSKMGFFSIFNNNPQGKSPDIWPVKFLMLSIMKVAEGEEFTLDDMREVLSSIYPEMPDE